MDIKNYSDLSSLEIDALREIGSIGTGNAATALSQMIGKPVRITLPEVRIMEYNEASNESAVLRPLPQVFWHSWGERSTASCSPYTSLTSSI